MSQRSRVQPLAGGAPPQHRNSAAVGPFFDGAMFLQEQPGSRYRGREASRDMRSESTSGDWRDLLRLRRVARRMRAILFPPPTPRHLALGKTGENLAVRYLHKNGHKILFRNFRAPHGGEVDIVCRDKRQNELVFVEVKTRTSEDFGRPLDAVDRKKRRLILRGAMTWLRMLDMPDIVFRFDVVEVVISSSTPVRHIENAFRMPDNYSY